jgi:chromosomal replication initiation ATPase DnaA
VSEFLSLWKGSISRMSLMSELAEDVCQEYGLTLEELRSPRRDRAIAWPRQDFMWRCRQVAFLSGAPRHSTTKIAEFLGLLDHTTILHGAKAHAARMAQALAVNSNNPQNKFCVDDLYCRTALTLGAG